MIIEIINGKTKIENLNENEIIKLDNSIIIILGIAFYKGKLLKKLEKNFFKKLINCNENEQYIKEIEGNYGIIIIDDKKINMFVDNNNIYKLYYYLDNETGTFFISDLVYNIGKKNKNLKINQLNILEYSFQFSILCDETIFDKVYSINGKEVIYYELDKNNILKKDKKLQINRNYLNEKEMSNILKRMCLNIKENFNNIAINMTGGVDSRIILASFLSVGVKPTLLYGIGNSIITNTRMEDFEIVKEISEKYNLELYIMNWKDNFEDWDQLIKKYGEYFLTYGGSKNLFEEYENLVQKYDFIEFGYFGETFRNLEFMDSEKEKKIDSKKLIDTYMYKLEVNENEILIKYKNNLEKKLKKIAEIEKIKIEKEIDFFDYLKIHRYYRYSADTTMYNLINRLGGHSMSVLSTFKIQNYISNVPLECKKDYKYIINLLKELEPSILNIPIFSHCAMRYYNREYNKVELYEKGGRIYKFLKTIKNKYFSEYDLFKLKKVLCKLRKKEEKYIKDEEKAREIFNEIFFKKIEEYEMKFFLKKIVCLKKFKEVNKRYLMRYYQTLYLLDKTIG